MIDHSNQALPCSIEVFETVNKPFSDERRPFLILNEISFIPP